VAMEPDEKAMLIDTIESLAAMSLIVGATLAILKQDVSNLRGRMLSALGNAHLASFPGDSDASRKILARATAFVNTI
jgi:hypothetical protein